MEAFMTVRPGVWRATAAAVTAWALIAAPAGAVLEAALKP
jgi:hypothetical protein